MSERNKSLRSFCFEAFEHLVYPNAVSNKTRSGFSDECKSVKSRNFFRLIIMFLNRTTFRCRTINNLHVSLSGVLIILKNCIRLTFEPPLTVYGQFDCSWLVKKNHQLATVVA